MSLVNASMLFVSIPSQYSGATLLYYSAGPSQDPFDTPPYPYAYGAPPSGVNYYETDIFGDGFQTSFSLSHPLNSFNVSISFDDYLNGPNGFPTSANDVQVDFSTAPSGTVHVTINKL